MPRVKGLMLPPVLHYDALYGASGGDVCVALERWKPVSVLLFLHFLRDTFCFYHLSGLRTMAENAMLPRLVMHLRSWLFDSRFWFVVVVVVVVFLGGVPFFPAKSEFF